MALTGTGVLVSQQLANTETTQYTAPTTVSGNPLKAVTIKSACLTNINAVGGADVTVSLSVLKSGQTADGTHRVVPSYLLRAGDTLILEMLKDLFLGPGDFISAIASAASSVTLVLSGVVLS